VAEKKAEFDALGADVAGVAFCDPSWLRAYRDDKKPGIPLFTDPDRAVYRALGLDRLSFFRTWSPWALWKYLRLLGAGRRWKPYGEEDVRQQGGDALVLPGGATPYLFRGRDSSDRPSVAELLAAVRRSLN